MNETDPLNEKGVAFEAWKEIAAAVAIIGGIFWLFFFAPDNFNGLRWIVAIPFTFGAGIIAYSVLNEKFGLNVLAVVGGVVAFCFATLGLAALLGPDGAPSGGGGECVGPPTEIC
ncbi:hypothetical protein [Qipengyuania seohaensis]|uniref:hypothetical protein n=1 Tax=Qipengyuania seohaensis TaxID=266951 RepID=UPI000C225F50|nr:hypothetical protein [Qipengyuania seohaensis]